MAADRDGPDALSRPVAYLVAAVAVLGATFVRYGLARFWGVEYPFVSFYPAVAVAAWFGGLGPGLLATTLSITCVPVLFIAPSGLPWIDDPRELVALALFAGFSTFISALIEALHRTRRRAERARGQAEAALAVVRRMQSITEAALVDLPFDRLLHELTARVREALEADTAVISLRKDAALQVRAAVGPDQDPPDGAGTPIGRVFAERIATERRPIVEKGLRSMAGVPLLSGEGRVLGVLHVDSARPRQFSDHDVHLLELAAERIALGIERAARMEAERRAREDAEAASRAKDDFLSTVSHELRTPLAAMMGWVRVVRDGNLTGERLRHAKLIEDLLDLTRIVAGKLRLQLQTVDLRPIVESAAESLRPMAEQKGVGLTLELDSAPVRIAGDADRLQQVVWNLVQNAVKFTPTGGRVEIELSRTRDHARVIVRDTGRGIAKDFLARLFEPFSQAASIRSRDTSGLGLGLSIARRLVELHGGTVIAESAGENAGATFTIALPLAASQTTDPPLPATRSAVASEAPSVLAAARRPKQMSS
jgi:signal transduction histidine kinase